MLNAVTAASVLHGTRKLKSCTGEVLVAERRSQKPGIEILPKT